LAHALAGVASTAVTHQTGLPAAPKQPLALLLIEDSPPYAALLSEMLHGILGASVEITAAATLEEGRERLREQRADCVILDLALPDAEGLEALRSVAAQVPSTPIVVLTGRDDDALAIAALQEGAQDFIPKRRADGELLVRAIRYAIERKRGELRLAHQALHDRLSGLPNRELLLDRIETALARSERSGRLMAVMFLDLDRFKTVNDSLGHQAGDELLVALADRLRALTRPTDTVARFGGDEFVVLCEELHGGEEAALVAERLRAKLSEPLVLRDRELYVSVSIGIAFAGGCSSAEELIQQADAAMYRAKQEGVGIALFESAFHEAALAALELEHQLRAALHRREFVLHYQPLLRVNGRPELLGVEALVRWDHPTLGLLGPDRFVPTAEESGLIVAIGNWVVWEGLRQLAHWREEGAMPKRALLSVNLSRAQLGSTSTVRAVADGLAAHGIPPANLWLELTESALARDEQAAKQTLAELRALGVRFALDDFGTGYSGLSALRSLPVEAVKIDRAFLAEAADDQAAARLFKAVLGVVQAAELRPIAEGVEREEQLELVRSCGCDIAQGFLLARPAPPIALTPLLRRLVRGEGQR